MNYEYLDMGAYNLHVIKTKKFKTVTVEVNFREKFDANNITIRNLLKTILINTTKKFPSERDLIRETENLYDLKLISSNARIGNYNNLSFKTRFLNEKYTEDDMNEYSIAFLLDIIFNPDVEDNKFNREILEKCKVKVEKSIKSMTDNKLKYSLYRLLETTENMPYSYSSFGNIDDLEKITVDSLYEYYKKVINENYVDVFVVGDVDSIKIKEIFKKYFKVNTFKKAKYDILVPELKARQKVLKKVEHDDVNQTQLTVLCSLNGLSEFERKYVLLVYNELLGGSSNSLLFDTVREKNSYAYYVNSIHKAYDNILMIYAGIEPGNSDNVLKLIKKTLQNISKGNFDDSLLENSKETIISGIKASKDSPAGIINTYYAKVLVNSLEFDERIENINKVSKEDVMNLSKKVLMHTLFLLEGDKNENN